MISKETKVDILVTPLITIGVGTGVAALIAPAWKSCNENWRTYNACN